ncbi:flagellar hook-length control protein FliK [Pseudoduganella umbonata]|uniref:Flagellar hook-length control protein FliK n=1 Tax=Pseudoduganella umbonata TaxID=864828 RepID=A0A4P8HQ61_9BURK|nr:flagellar hook-length control protein FliK [Pseudoduganella umbonata]MBB3221434.1 flagellar hook-length control protein FliK [Pseudoduganella umbonata]QCP10590.1 flagellar hook-length control protein FliK [Pseudoduganella umbonata]
MMINTPSAPGGAAAAPSALPGVALGDAAFAATPAPAEGTPAGTAEGAGLPALFAQMLDFASLAAPAGTPAVAANSGQPADEAADTGTDLETDAGMPLAAMMTTLPFALLPGARAQLAPAASAITATGTLPGAANNGQPRGATLLGTAADAIANAAASSAAATPLAARLLQGALPAGDAAAPRADARQPAASTGSGTATPSGAAAPATVLAAQDGTAQPGNDGQSGQPQGDGQATFRGVMAAAAPAAGAPADTVKLVGNPDQWQQPLRAALGDRLQVTLQKGNDQAVNQAVIRLEPPNLGSIEISIRQSAGALHVSMSATNSEVVRQLNAVGDLMRQDLSQRQQGDVAVTVSQASSRSLADSEGRGRQPEREAEQQREQRGPGRALNEGDDTNTTFAMLRE